MNRIGYPYSYGNKVEDRNTYFYSSYGGKSFLDAYYSSRLAVISELGKKRSPECNSEKEPQGITDEGIDTAVLIHSLRGMFIQNRMNQESWALVSKLIQRFEVSKRVFPEYGLNWRPKKASDYSQLDLYLSFASLMEAAYSCRAGLTELNALLKVLDSLVSIRDLLDLEQKGHVGWLIQREMDFVKDLYGSLESNHVTQ